MLRRNRLFGITRGFWFMVAAALSMAAAGRVGAATVRGRITRCDGTVPAPGFVVKAFEQDRVGIKGLNKPCTIVTQNAFLVGTATAGADGSYSISYTPAEEEPDSCLFEPNVFIKVFQPDGVTLVNTSAEKRLRTSLVFSFDLGPGPDCPQLLVPGALTFDPPSIISGGPSTVARISLLATGGPVAVPTTVTLFASDASDLEMERTVVIPANQTSAELIISASPPEGKLVTIFASANGVTVSADLAIRPNGPMKGLINADGQRNIADAIFLLNFLFAGGPAPRFIAFADVNGSGKADISDAVAVLNFLFTGNDVPALCTRDPSTLPRELQLGQEITTDGEKVDIFGEFPDPIYRIVLRGFSFPNGRLVSGTQVVGERRLVYCTCLPAVRSPRSGPDGEVFFAVPFNVPLDAPSGEYEVFLLPDGPDCPAGSGLDGGCIEDTCAIGPMKLFVQPSHIVSLWDELDVHDNSEPSGDNPSELFFTFGSQTGEPDSTERFPVQFADSFPGGRPGSQHLASGDNAFYTPNVPVFVGREADMERTECEEECLSDPDPARCRAACAEAARRMNNNIVVTLGGAEFDCLEGCGSIWDEVAAVGVTALGCFVGFKTGNIKEGCGVGVGLGAIVDSKLGDALEDEDDVLGAVEFDFTRGAAPFWGVGATAPPGGLGKVDIDIGVHNHRVPALRVVDAKITLRSVTLVEADDEPCFAPDELFFETRASLGLNGRLGKATRFPSAEGIPTAEGETKDLSSFSLDAGGGAETSFVYVEIGVWDFDGDDEDEQIGLYSDTIFLGDLLETPTPSDFVVDGHERRRVVRNVSARVSGWNSGERCDCSGIFACAFNPRLPHGIADISYDVEVTWEKYPQQ